MLRLDLFDANFGRNPRLCGLDFLSWFERFAEIESDLRFVHGCFGSVEGPCKSLGRLIRI